MNPDETPEADAVEQDLPAAAEEDSEVRLGPETPEADAVEQSRAVPFGEDEEERA